MYMTIIDSACDGRAAVPGPHPIELAAADLWSVDTLASGVLACRRDGCSDDCAPGWMLGDSNRRFVVRLGPDKYVSDSTGVLYFTSRCQTKRDQPSGCGARR